MTAVARVKGQARRGTPNMAAARTAASAARSPGAPAAAAAARTRRPPSARPARLPPLLVLLAAAAGPGAGGAARLYRAGEDAVWVLDSGSVRGATANSSAAWLVQFYSSWCGHCIGYAPTWRALAADVRGEARLARGPDRGLWPAAYDPRILSSGPYPLALWRCSASAAAGLHPGFIPRMTPPAPVEIWEVGCQVRMTGTPLPPPPSLSWGHRGLPRLSSPPDPLVESLKASATTSAPGLYPSCVLTFISSSVTPPGCLESRFFEAPVPVPGCFPCRSFFILLWFGELSIYGGYSKRSSCAGDFSVEAEKDLPAFHWLVPCAWSRSLGPI